ncbi:MAG: hypothetical protein ACE5FG_09075 [Myxococcota bacterium]
MASSPRPLVRTLSLVALGSVLAIGAQAQTLDGAQQRCVNELNQGLARLARGAGKELARCLKDAARGRLGSLSVADCLAADRRGRLQRIRTREAADFARFCAGVVADPPPFGPVDLAEVDQAAIDKELDLLEVLFGSDVDASVVSRAADPRTSKCQRAVTKAVFRCQDAKLQQFNRCKREVLEAGADSAAQLEACMGADPVLKILRACDPAVGGIRQAIRRSCLRPPVELPAAFPSCGTADPSELHDCLEAGVECAVCTALNRADRLNRNCDEFDDGLANGSCLSGTLQAGTCLRKITPIVGVNHSAPIFMAGFGNDRQATGVHDDLWVRATVLDQGGRRIALATLDVVGYFFNEVKTIRSLVDPALGIDSITITSTHNHEGPDTMGLWGPDSFTSGVDVGYLDFVNAEVASCIEEAATVLVPAEMRFATGTTVGSSLPPNTDLVGDGKVLQALTIDLSLIGETGTIEVLGDSGPVINPSVPAFQIRDRRSKDVLVTLVNFASHPESLGSSNTLITADFPHFMREALEARYGGMAVYLSGDLGVLQGPLDVDLEDPQNPSQTVPRRTFAFAERMGELLAERAGDALDLSTLWLSAPELETRSVGPIVVEVENPFFQALVLFGLFGRRTGIPGVSPLSIESEVQVLRIGPAQIAVTPNELDPQIGDEYRALMTQASHRFIAGLGNDEIGYQMQAEKFNPTCFLCFFDVLFGDPADCPLFSTLDCSTVFINNIGPGADGQLQGLLKGEIQGINP